MVRETYVCVYVLLYIAAAYFVFLSRLEEENGDLEYFKLTKGWFGVDITCPK